MKNNGKTEANRKNTDESIWNFYFEWPEIDIKWDLSIEWDNSDIVWENNDIKWDLIEIEWPVIDIIWSTDDYCWDTKKNSEDNVRGGKES
jgi:hypothetical protein